jgi:hypothetical protein
VLMALVLILEDRSEDEDLALVSEEVVVRGL